MDDLIIRVLSGHASPFEAERLKHWREQGAENERHFQDLARVWSLTAPEPVAPSSAPPSVDVILERAGEVRRARPGALRPSRRARWIRWGLLAAAAAAVTLVVRGVTPHGLPLIAEYEAPSDGPSTVTLGDGSFVRLGPGSRLEEVEAEGGREVVLEGRAFFAVARDETRPFVVRVGAGEVRVLGTRFQVETEADHVQAVVVEGLVKVSNRKGWVDVPAGSVAQMSMASPPTSQVVENVYSLLDWPGGVLVFQGTALEQVAQEVSRFYGRTLRVVGGELSSRRVTASFQGESFEEAAESLCLVTQAECRAEGTGVTMHLPGEGRRIP